MDHFIAIKNTLYQVGSRALSSSFSLILSILIVRATGVDLYGDFSLVVTILMVFTILSEFGSNTSSIKLFSERNYLYENFISYVVFRLILSVIAYVVFAVFIFLSTYSLDLKLLMVLGSPLILFGSIGKSFSLLFQAIRDYKHQLYASLVSWTFASFALIYLYYYGQINTQRAIFVMLISICANTLYCLFTFRNLPLVYKIKKADYMFFLLKDSWILGLVMIINFLMINIDRILMSKYSDFYNIGVYSIAYKVFELVLIIPTFLMNTYYPYLLDLSKDIQRYNRSFLNILYRLAFGGIVVGIALYVFTPYIVLLWGENTSDVILALRALSIGTVLFYISSPLSWYIINSKFKLHLIYIYLAGFILNTTLNILYLGQYGYLAASYITLLTEVFVILIMSLVSNKIRRSMTRGV